MRIECPHCGKRGTIPDGAKLPAKARCPACKKSFAPSAALMDQGSEIVAEDKPLKEFGTVARIETQNLPAPLPPFPPPAPTYIDSRAIFITPTPIQAPVSRTCDFCGESIQSAAKKCRHCGETLDPVLRAAEEAKRLATRQSQGPPAAPVTVHNTIVNSASASAAAVVKGSRSSSAGCGCLALLIILAMLAMLSPRRRVPQEAAPAVAPALPFLKPAERQDAKQIVPLPKERPVDDDDREPAQDVAPMPQKVDATKATDNGVDITTMMKMGGNLEGRNPAAAMRYYEDIVKKFPDSPEAVNAAKRIAVLKEK